MTERDPGTPAAPAPSAMRQAFRRLASESLVYGLGQAGGRAVQLLLVPILTRALDPQVYGVSELVLGYSQTVVLVLVLGMDGALARFFYQEPDREARIRMMSTSFAFRAVVAITCALLIAAFAGRLAGPLFGGDVYSKYLRIGAITMPFSLFVMFGNDVLRVTFQPWKFVTLNLTQTVLTTSLALYFVVPLGLGVAGVLYGRLGGDALAAALAIVLIRHMLRPRFDLATLRRMLAYGVPAVPSLVAFGIMASIDRFVLQRTRSLEELAVYAVAMKFFTVVTFGASAFQLAYGPFAYARSGTPEAPRLYARALAAYVGLGSVGALLVGVFAPEALAVLTPRVYHGAALPAVLLAFAAVAFGAYTVSAIGIGLALKTPWLGACAGSGLVLGTAAQWALAPRFGPIGAAAATWIGYVTATALTYIVAQRVHPLPYRGGRLLAFFVAATVAGVAAQHWSPPGPYGLAIKLAVVAAFAGFALGLAVGRLGRPARTGV